MGKRRRSNRRKGKGWRTAVSGQERKLRKIKPRSVPRTSGGGINNRGAQGLKMFILGRAATTNKKGEEEKREILLEQALGKEGAGLKESSGNRRRLLSTASKDRQENSKQRGNNGFRKMRVEEKCGGNRMTWLQVTLRNGKGGRKLGWGLGGWGGEKKIRQVLC